jgi:outer membrane receptor protein involved in Fe transport
MMKAVARYLHFFVLCSVAVLPSLYSTAQHKGTIYGSVYDKQGPVEFASVLMSSAADTAKIVHFCVTDSLGNFTLSNVEDGSYLLKVKFIGYTEARVSIQVDSANRTIAMPPIPLSFNLQMLNGIEIMSHKDLIKKTPGGFIFTATDNITQGGGTAGDLLKNIPTVVVDMEGGVTIRGKTPLILINGRNSTLGEIERIPASSIESIEIINNPTAEYDADAEGGIINIKLKKNTGKGTNGSVGMGVGCGSHGRINSSFIINHRVDKWNFGLSYDNRFAGRTRKIEAHRTQFDLPSQFYLVQNREDDRLELSQNLKLNIDFTPDEKNSFSFEAIGNLGGQDNDEMLYSTFRTQSDTFNSKNERQSIEIGREQIMEYAFMYSRKFSDLRTTLKINVSSSFDFDAENTDIRTQSLTESDYFLGSPYFQRTSNYQNSNVSNFRIDYSHGLGKKGTIEMGYKGVYRFTDADFQSQYLVAQEYITNPAASTVFHFREQIHAGYLQYRAYVGEGDSLKWKYDIGIRGEQVFNEGFSESNSISVDRAYFNVFPTGNLAFYFKGGDFLKLSFGRRINRPDLEDLNPFIDITDSVSQHGGNPYLKPELVNAAEFGYNKEWKKVTLSANLFYRYTTNIIRSFIVLQSNGVALTQPQNFGNATTYGVEGILSTYLAKFWSMNTSLSAFQQNIDDSNIGDDISSSVFSWYGKMINNFVVWKDGKLQLTANYNSPLGTPQGKRVAVYYLDLGFQQKLFNGKAGLGIIVTDVFNTQINGYSASADNFSYDRKFKIDTRAVIVTFAWSFGTSFKEEMIENKFSND